MPRSPHLLPEDFADFDILEYQLGKDLDTHLWDSLSGMAGLLNTEREENPDLGGIIETPCDAIVRLPGGSYVTISWSLQAMDPQEAETEIMELLDE